MRKNKGGVLGVFFEGKREREFGCQLVVGVGVIFPFIFIPKKNTQNTTPPPLLLFSILP